MSNKSPRDRNPKYEHRSLLQQGSANKNFLLVTIFRPDGFREEIFREEKLAKVGAEVAFVGVGGKGGVSRIGGFGK